MIKEFGRGFLLCKPVPYYTSLAYKWYLLGARASGVFVGVFIIVIFVIALLGAVAP